jgi:hypothetical protein
LIFNGSHAKRGFEIALRPHYYKVFVEGSGEVLFTKRASPLNAYVFYNEKLMEGAGASGVLLKNMKKLLSEPADGT